MSKLNIISRRDWRIAVLSDLHCGHYSGLTVPAWQGRFIPANIGKHNKVTQIQKELWNFYETEINTLKREQKIDICICNGDAIDGTGDRSGGTELLTTDRNKQVEIAKEALEIVKANHYLIVAGTAYHTGEREDFEENLAKDLKGKFENHAWLDINGKIFDIKHHIGSSGVPQGRFSPIAREAVWGKLWGEAKLIPQHVHYMIRSHVHYFSLVDDGDMIAMTTPALQAFGSKYGARRCSGIPKIGFVSFDVKVNGQVIMRKHFANMPTQVARATVFN